MDGWSTRVSRACLTTFLAPVLAGAVTLQEDFATDPLARGWRFFGNNALFHWNAANQNLEMTWDSSQTNSYFQLPLGTIVARDDDFSFALDLRLDDVTAGVNPEQPSTFELAFGLQNVVNAQATNFFRGTGKNLPNLVEFDFFPDTGFGATIWPIAWSTNAVPNYNGSGDYTLLDLPLGLVLRVAVAYSASNQTIVTTITTNGVSIGGINPVPLAATFTDFRVGTFALESYSAAGQSGPFAGSLLAHGVIDNILVTVPPPPVGDLHGGFTNGLAQAVFTTRSNWVYILERSADFSSWTAASAAAGGTGGTMTVQDTNGPAPKAFYRVRAERP